MVFQDWQDAVDWQMEDVLTYNLCMAEKEYVEKETLYRK